MLPAWVQHILVVTAALVVLVVLVGAGLLWRDRRRLNREADRLEILNESLSITGSRLARMVHDLREVLNQMRWGRGPQP